LLRHARPYAAAARCEPVLDELEEFVTLADM